MGFFSDFLDGAQVWADDQANERRKKNVDLRSSEQKLVRDLRQEADELRAKVEEMREAERRSSKKLQKLQRELEEVRAEGLLTLAKRELKEIKRPPKKTVEPEDPEGAGLAGFDDDAPMPMA